MVPGIDLSGIRLFVKSAPSSSHGHVSALFSGRQLWYFVSSGSFLEVDVTISRMTAVLRHAVRLPSRTLSLYHVVRVQERGFVTSSLPRAQQQDVPKQDKAPSSSMSASPLSPSAPPPRSYSPLTVKIVKGIATLLGYNRTSSMAIRVTSELYDRCAARADEEADFWYGSESI